MGDLRSRVPAQSLIEKLLDEWDAGRIHRDESGGIVIEDEARGWYDGVLGERQTALELSLLGPEWTVLHSIPIGERGTDIDHLAIGPTGVFVINSKRHPGKTVTAGGLGMRLNSIGVPHLSSIARQAAQVAERLSARCGFAVPVEGVLSFIDVDRIVIKAALGDGSHHVSAVRAGDVTLAVQGDRAMSDEQIARVIAVATLPITWSRSAPTTRLGTHMVQEFAALENAVRPHLSPPRQTTRSSPAARTMLGNKPRPKAPGRGPRRIAATRKRSGRRRGRGAVSAVVAVLFIVFVFFAAQSIAQALVSALRTPATVSTTPSPSAPTPSATPTHTP